MENPTSDPCFLFHIFQTLYLNSAISLSVLGSFLNLICLSVLVKPELDSVFTRLRILLATFDLVYLTSDALHKGAELHSFQSLSSVSFVIVSVSSSGSAYTTVAIALERCYAILDPVTSGHNKADVTSRRRVFASYFYPVVFFSLLHNFVDSNASLSSVFDAYTFGYQVIVIFRIVLTILRIVVYISANFCIFVVSQRFRKKNFTIPNDNQSAFVLQMALIFLSLFLLHIYGVNYLTNDLFKNETDAVACGLGKGETVWHEVLFNIIDILWILNSVCNVFIYSFFSAKFRNIFRKTYRLSILVLLRNKVKGNWIGFRNFACFLLFCSNQNSPSNNANAVTGETVVSNSKKSECNLV